MKYAIFSDIHSNLEAYEAVLEKIASERVEGYYCCGDIVGYGADHSACIDKTREIKACIVAGNHDWGSVGLADINNFTENAKAAVLWTTAVLSEKEKDYLKTLKPTYKDKFMLAHASPDRPEEFEYIFDLSSAYKALSEMEKGTICFVGHTHMPGAFIENRDGYVGYNPWPQIKVEKDTKYLVNVGSVGQPRDGDPRAAYCIYDTDNRVIGINRTKYDIKTAQYKIIKAGLPAALAERLSLGR